MFESFENRKTEKAKCPQKRESHSTLLKTMPQAAGKKHYVCTCGVPSNHLTRFQKSFSSQNHLERRKPSYLLLLSGFQLSLLGLCPVATWRAVSSTGPGPGAPLPLPSLERRPTCEASGTSRWPHPTDCAPSRSTQPP